MRYTADSVLAETEVYNAKRVRLVMMVSDDTLSVNPFAPTGPPSHRGANVCLIYGIGLLLTYRLIEAESLGRIIEAGGMSLPGRYAWSSRVEYLTSSGRDAG
jgi:hypothetical protein